MAKGSHATFDGYPRTCANCGQPVRITGTEPLLFQWTPTDGRRSWHIRCLDRTTTERPTRGVASSVDRS